MSVDAVVKRSVFWANDRLHGAPIRHGFDEISHIMANYDEGFEIQQQKLRDVLSFAAKNTTLYASYKDKIDCLNAWPVMNKVMLMEHYDENCVDIDKIPGQVGDIFIQKTSGSTGVPFSLPHDTRKRQRRISEIKWFNDMVGFKSHEMLIQCRIWTKWHTKSKSQMFRENIIAFNIEHMDDETISELISTIKKKHCVAMRAYASWYKSLCEYLVDGKGNPQDLSSLKVCISHSEMLDERTKALMEKLVGCPMVDCYANEENGIFAYQRLNSNDYVLNHAGYVFEVLNFDNDEPVSDGELGRLVVTDLTNRAFPMIRYDTGDAVVFRSDPGLWPVMTKLYGRRMDVIYDAAGLPVHPMAFARILKNYSQISQWQVIQTGEKNYTVRLCLRDELGIYSVRNQFFEIVGDSANITFEEADDIPVLNSGKKKSVIQEWKV